MVLFDTYTIQLLLMHRRGSQSFSYGSLRWGVLVLAVLVAGMSSGMGQMDGAVPEIAMGAERDSADVGLAVQSDTSVRPARAGAPVPDFEVEHLRDSTRTFSPSDFEGRYVLLNLWATWCAPCIKKIPTLQTARQRYSDETLAILNVSFDRNRSAVTDLLNDHEIPGRHAFVGISALGGDFGAMFARVSQDDPSMRGLPNLALVDPNGQVVATLGPTDERTVLDVLKTHLP